MVEGERERGLPWPLVQEWGTTGERGEKGRGQYRPPSRLDGHDPDPAPPLTLERLCCSCPQSRAKRRSGSGASCLRTAVPPREVQSREEEAGHKETMLMMMANTVFMANTALIVANTMVVMANTALMMANTMVMTTNTAMMMVNAVMRMANTLVAARVMAQSLVCLQ